MLAQNGRLIAHSASTLKGSSGGPLVDPDTLMFVGIRMCLRINYSSNVWLDIEGWADVNWNLAVDASHPAFINAYRQIVLPALPNDSRILFDAVNN